MRYLSLCHARGDIKNGALTDGAASELELDFAASAEEETFSSEFCSLREAGSLQVTPSSVDEASVPSTTKVSAVDLKSELKDTSVTLLNPAAAEWVPN